MKKHRPARPPNPAAEALANAEFRQRVVKAKKNNRYSRKEKHKKREGTSDGLPVFICSTTAQLADML